MHRFKGKELLALGLTLALAIPLSFLPHIQADESDVETASSETAESQDLDDAETGSEESDENLGDEADEASEAATTEASSETPKRRSRRAAVEESATGWLVFEDSIKYKDPETGQFYKDGVYVIGKRSYLFDQDGNLFSGWYDASNGKRYYANDYGQAYRQGAFDASDGIRYVFAADGSLALGQWVDEPGYGRAYGNPKTGAAYRLGAFTAEDGVRYVFDRYGYLAMNRFVDEPGYGMAYGQPKTGIAYTSGAWTVRDGIRYTFDRWGYLAKGKWVHEQGYGWTYGDPETGASFSNGNRVLADGSRHVFNAYGYAQQGWVFDDRGGYSYGFGEKAAAVRNRRIRMNGRLYTMDAQGYWADRQRIWNPKNLDYSEDTVNQKLYATYNGAYIKTPFIVNGETVFVSPIDAAVAHSPGWKYYGDKEFYFLEPTRIAKPYQKIGNAYVNGGWGSRIHALEKGIDVSEHNATINWNSVKDDDVTFAYIRASYAETTDKRFLENITRANAAGLKTGVYVYSYAETEKEAVEEAEHLLKILRGHRTHLPVVFDLEDDSIVKSVRTRRDRTRLFLAFAKRIEAAGYKVALYSNLNWLNNYLDRSMLSGYEIWLAHWNDQPGERHALWQASEKGRVSGINTNVDIDFAFKPF